MPSFIACKTTIGFGAPTKAGTNMVHGAALGTKEIEGARENLKWDSEPFEIPSEIEKRWKEVGTKSVSDYKDW
jgi:transketolase